LAGIPTSSCKYSPKTEAGVLVLSVRLPVLIFGEGIARRHSEFVNDRQNQLIEFDIWTPR
jgi:hypothetical protein